MITPKNVLKALFSKNNNSDVFKNVFTKIDLCQHNVDEESFLNMIDIFKLKLGSRAGCFVLFDRNDNVLTLEDIENLILK